MASGKATGRDGAATLGGLRAPNVHNKQQSMSPTKRRQQTEPTEAAHPGRLAAWRSRPCSREPSCSPSQSVVTAPKPPTRAPEIWQHDRCTHVPNKSPLFIFITARLIKSDFCLFQAIYKLYIRNLKMQETNLFLNIPCWDLVTTWQDSETSKGKTNKPPPPKKKLIIVVSNDTYLLI